MFLLMSSRRKTPRDTSNFCFSFPSSSKLRLLRNCEVFANHSLLSKDELAQYLYQKETITGDEFMEILNRKDDPAKLDG